MKHAATSLKSFEQVQLDRLAPAVHFAVRDIAGYRSLGDYTPPERALGKKLLKLVIHKRKGATLLQDLLRRRAAQELNLPPTAFKASKLTKSKKAHRGAKVAAKRAKVAKPKRRSGNRV